MVLTISSIRLQIEQYEHLESGWIYEKFKCAHLDLAKYDPLTGGRKIIVPKKVKNMKSVLCINSPDTKCFLYSVIGGLLHIKDQLPNKVSHKYTKYLPHLDLVDYSMIKYPVSIKQIRKFEKTNNLSISVFSWCTDDESVIPLKNGSGIGQPIDLLILVREDNSHYVLIKNFNAFMRHRTKYHNTMFCCRKCLHGFIDEKHQIQHSILCTQSVNQIISMPKPGVIQFKATHKQEKKQFVVIF